ERSQAKLMGRGTTWSSRSAALAISRRAQTGSVRHVRQIVASRLAGAQTRNDAFVRREAIFGEARELGFVRAAAKELCRSRADLILWVGPERMIRRCRAVTFPKLRLLTR